MYMGVGLPVLLPDEPDTGAPELLADGELAIIQATQLSIYIKH